MSFITSLWNHMSPPFRALDEWDVFLDPLNRKKVAEKLVKQGLQKRSYQWFFISPQGAGASGDLGGNENVEIREVLKSA